MGNDSSSFDPDYYITVLDFIKSRDWLKFDTWYNVDDYATIPEKFIFHLKYYIDRVKIASDIDITLSDDHRSRFMLTEPFVNNLRGYHFPLKKETTPLPQFTAESKTVKKKDPFANLRPKAKQGEIF